MKSILIILLSLTAGCATSSKIVTKPEPQHNWVEEWKVKAAQRHLYYRIECTSWAKDGAIDAFNGRAAIVPLDRTWQYAEDGGQPSWFVIGNSQEEVAMKLIAEVDAPMGQPRSREQEKAEQHHRQCPVPIVGGPKSK